MMDAGPWFCVCNPNSECYSYTILLHTRFDLNSYNFVSNAVINEKEFFSMEQHRIADVFFRVWLSVYLVFLRTYIQKSYNVSMIAGYMLNNVGYYYAFLYAI